MEIRELRIGNYVTANKINGKVQAICRNSQDHIEIKTPDDKIVEANINDVNPIPLTDGLLSKCCDFDKTKRHALVINNDGHFLKLADNYIVLLNNKGEELVHFWDVSHLHKLQNLYFALKGEEMKVSLD